MNTPAVPGADRRAPRPWRMLWITFAWGSCFVAISVGLQDAPLLWLAALRALVAGAALLILTVIRRAPVPREVRSWTLIGVLGVVNVASSMLFGGISGSAVADTSALGSILMPVMKEKGYDGDYAVNVTVTSSVAGVVIPPSHNMILFAVAAGGVSVSKLFIAGIVPGVLMCLCLGVVAYVIAVKRGYPAETFPGFKSLAISTIVALPGLMTAVIIVGGVLSGALLAAALGASARGCFGGRVGASASASSEKRLATLRCRGLRSTLSLRDTSPSPPP